MEIENTNSQEQEEVTSKKDDFFDDEPPKQNADSTELVNGGDAKEAEGDAEANAGKSTQDPEALVACGGVSNNAEPASINGKPEAEVGAEEGAETVAAEHTEDPADDGFQSTIPQAVPDVVTTVQEQEQTEYVQEEEEKSKSPEPKTFVTEQESEPNEVDVDQEETSEVVAIEEEVAPSSDSKEVVYQQQQQQQQQEESEEQEVEYKYDDDHFSEHSLASIDSGGKTLDQNIEKEKSVDREEEAFEPSEMREGSVSSPTQSRTDSRAETIDTVDPAPIPTDEPVKMDDRSSLSDIKENGEYRGEDRTDLAPLESTEDSRGQGHWKTAEQQYIASAVLAQKSEQEALKEVEEERDKLVADNAALQIKDLQEKLDVLARESEEKDKKYLALEDELRSTKRELQQRENQLEEYKTKLAKALAEASAGGGDAPKSKTCILM